MKILPELIDSLKDMIFDLDKTIPSIENQGAR